MKELIKGANAPLAASGKIRFHLNWRTAPNGLDLACFALDARDRVPSDSWFLFYNQPNSPGGAIRFDPRTSYFLIDLNQLPAGIRRCVFTATLPDGHLVSVNDLNLEATAATGAGARYRLAEPVSGRSLLIAELYRHNDQWKIRAKGDGLKENLAMLAHGFGVDVQDDENRDDTTSARHTREPITRRRTAVSTPATVSPPPPPPAPKAVASPIPVSAPVSTPPPPAPVNLPVPLHDKHEKLKTYATLAIAFGSLTTAITTLITQCTPHPAVVMMQSAPSPTPSLPSSETHSTSATGTTTRTITQYNSDPQTDFTPAMSEPRSPHDTSWNNR